MASTLTPGVGIDNDTQAAKDFYKAVRNFAIRTKVWQTALWHFVTPDEIWDTSLVSQRVYGYRDEFLAVMAAAGIDSVDQPLPQAKLCLPTAAQIYYFKRQSGFESIANLRNNFAPTWSN